MKHIIIINGCGGVGKDTFINFCSKYSKVENYSSVKEIKEVATLLGWNGEKSDKDRKFLSDLKLLASEYSKFSFHCILNHVDEFLKSDKEIMFIHIRDIFEIKEVIEAIKNKVKVSTLLVKNDGISPSRYSNSADANVYEYRYDYYIENNESLIELEEKALHFIKFLSKIDN